MAGRDIMQKVKPSILRFFDEAETVSIIKKILGFEKKGCFMNVTLRGHRRSIVDVELEIVEEICTPSGARRIWAASTAKSGTRTASPSSIPATSWIFPQMFGTMDTVATLCQDIEKIYLGDEEGHQRQNSPM